MTERKPGSKGLPWSDPASDPAADILEAKRRVVDAYHNPPPPYRAEGCTCSARECGIYGDAIPRHAHVTRSVMCPYHGVGVVAVPERYLDLLILPELRWDYDHRR